MKLPGRSQVWTIPLLLAALCGCQGGEPRSDFDPLEDLNRGIYWFNTQVDTVIIKPVATGWSVIAPEPVQDGVANFFSNLRFPINFINNLLQGDPEDAFSELGRFLVNSTAGLGGFIDVASEIGLESCPADFGQTLGVWGIEPGPYFMIPILGPTNFRDGAGLVADAFSQPLNYFVDLDILLYAASTELVNRRARELRLMEAFHEAALDPYSAMRDAYFQRRQALIAGEEYEPPKDDSMYDLSRVNE